MNPINIGTVLQTDGSGKVYPVVTHPAINLSDYDSQLGELNLKLAEINKKIAEVTALKTAYTSAITTGVAVPVDVALI